MNLNVPRVLQQIDDECGPYCVAQVLSFYGVSYDTADIIEACSASYKFRDWDYQMGTYLLGQGLSVEIHTYHDAIFDPTWHELEMSELREKLHKELSFLYSDSPRLSTLEYQAWHDVDREISEIESAIKFIDNGGSIKLKPISVDAIISLLSEGKPIICAFNSLLLHRMKRRFRNKADELGGTGMGHIAVISGYKGRNFIMTDPSDWYRNDRQYEVGQDELVNSILLQDPNLIVASKKD